MLYLHNLFFFLDNLSKWDIHTRPYFRKYYPNAYKKIKEHVKDYKKSGEKKAGRKTLKSFSLKPV